ncbi:hypothetical protein AwWohl_09590 [Gammaproteobacteria bacterium]|nr:hypothetical protein AwWohl_09590 [Gammaproteobacteria bacterium]
MEASTFDELKDNLRTQDYELKQYLELIEHLEHLEKIAIRKKHKSEQINIQLKISVSSCYLLFYNIIEHVCRESFLLVDASICEHTQDYSFLNLHLKGEYLKRIRQITLKPGIFDLLKNNILINAIKELKIDKKDLFNGNISNKIISAQLGKFGITNFKPDINTNGGADLDRIKQIRNELTHGEKSFVEMQQELKSSAQIEDEWERVRTYLEDLIEVCDQAIHQRYFLADSCDE